MRTLTCYRAVALDWPQSHLRSVCPGLCRKEGKEKKAEAGGAQPPEKEKKAEAEGAQPPEKEKKKAEAGGARPPEYDAAAAAAIAVSTAAANCTNLSACAASRSSMGFDSDMGTHDPSKLTRVDAL